MKKVLSLVLVMAMVLSSMSFAFGASNLTDIVDTDYEDAINTLVGLGIVAGYEDGTFRPEKTITRAEMAKMMVVTLGYGDLVAGSKSNFADTQGHWADAYIALAAGKGIVQGDGNGKFRPDAIVSYDEAITMLVRGLGYTDTCNELKNMTWPTNFKVKAAELKLTKDVTLSSNGADRGGVAQLINNALKTALVTVNTDGDVIKATTTTTNSDNEVVTKYVLLLSRLATSKTIAKVTPEYLDEDSKLYAGDIVDLAPYMYQEIEVFENDDDEVVYVNDVESDVKIGEFRHAKDDANKINIRIDGKNKLYKLNDSDETPVFYNGVEVIMSETEMENGSSTLVDLHKAAATFVLNDDDEIVGIIASKYTEAKKVTNVYNGKSKFEGFNLPLDDDDEVDYKDLTVKGIVDSIDDIEEDDVIVLYAGGGLKSITGSTEPEKLTIEVVRDVIEGKITAKNSDDEFLIDGEYHAVSPFADYVFGVADEGVFYLDNKGQLVDFDDEATTAGNYAVVIDVMDGYYNEDSGRMIVEPQIKLVTANGDEVTYDVKSTAKFKSSPSASDVALISGDHDEDINDSLANYTVVKYTINGSDEITRITVQGANNTGTLPSIDTDSKGFVLANNVVIFNKDGDDVDVADVDDLGDEIDVLFKIENKNGQYELLFVDGLGTSDTYAYIVDSGTVLNDDEDEVQSITAYVDGVKVVYEVEAGYTVTSSSIDSHNMVKLNLDGSVIESVNTPVSTVAQGKLIADNSEVTRVNGSRIQVGSAWYTLADDVAVYILDDGEFDEVGDAASVYTGAKIAGYAFDEDNQDDNIIEVLFIFE